VLVVESVLWQPGLPSRNHCRSRPDPLVFSFDVRAWEQTTLAAQTVCSSIGQSDRKKTLDALNPPVSDELYTRAQRTFFRRVQSTLDDEQTRHSHTDLDAPTPAHA
jgi:hypothetical protein